ncbi:hypothetical protein SAMN05428963_12236 [Consotaella salsifontis]|uniref:Uncharacterized protein n=2 Tax=Consotaella salsifontis TaxID=1365950 RepID=A0A1T4TAS6_9HYPH|nr:hypothetical protein SAMN05428963_12236 [Consotaella salsifontis]
MILKAVGTAIEQTIIEGLYEDRFRNKAGQIVDLHQRIALCARNETQARQAMEDHFDSVVHDLLEVSRPAEDAPLRS